MKCISGKRSYASEHAAVEALIGAHIAFHYNRGDGPLSVYHCSDCGFYHLTSRPPMHPQLKEELENGSIQRERESREWEKKLR